MGCLFRKKGRTSEPSTISENKPLSGDELGLLLGLYGLRRAIEGLGLRAPYPQQPLSPKPYFNLLLPQERDRESVPGGRGGGRLAGQRRGPPQQLSEDLGHPRHLHLFFALGDTRHTSTKFRAFLRVRNFQKIPQERGVYLPH